MDLDNYLKSETESGWHESERVERPVAKPGVHSFGVFEASLEESKTNGLPMYKLRLRIMDDEGESPYADVWSYLAHPAAERKAIAEAAGRRNPNPFLKDQLNGFFASIGWTDGAPKTELAAKGLCGKTGEVEFRMGKASTGADGTAYPAKLEPNFAGFLNRAAQQARAAPTPEAAIESINKLAGDSAELDW